MPLPAWPAIPYSPQVGTYQVERTAEAPISTEMNAGTTRRRRKFTLRIASVSMTLLMTNEEAETFREFHEDTLSDGAARFTMPVHFAGVFRTQTVLFAEPPAYDHFIPGYVKVSFGLLVENIGSGAIVVYVPPDDPGGGDGTPEGALLLPDNSSALLLPDGTSFFLRPSGGVSASSFLLPDNSSLLLPDGSSSLLLP
jgi:hypothetical protein